MVTPVQPRERVVALDILRAVALFGILVMNLWGMSASWYHDKPAFELWPAWYDGAALWVKSTFFEGKFNSLFTLLFGVGFTIQLTRLDAEGNGTRVYLRRLAVLFVFGLIHNFGFWTGDVLHMYAILGVGLLSSCAGHPTARSSRSSSC